MNIKNIIKNCAWQISLAFTILLLAGCAGLTKAQEASIVLVNNSTKAWQDYRKTGLATPQQITTVSNAYVKYYDAIQIEKKTLIAYKNGGTNSANAAIAAATVAAGEVAATIIQFLPPSKAANLKGQ